MSWLEDQLVRVLDSNARINYVISYSKRWFNGEVKKARRDFGRVFRQARKPGGDPEVFREARNLYKRTLKRAKRECWQQFLLGEDDQESGPQGDTNRYWTALKYTNPSTQICTPALQDANGNWATTMESKEAMVQAKAFPSPPQSVKPDVRPGIGSTHLRITNKDVRKALFNQAIKKAPGPSKLNFRAMRLLWS